MSERDALKKILNLTSSYDDKRTCLSPEDKLIHAIRVAAKEGLQPKGCPDPWNRRP